MATFGATTSTTNLTPTETEIRLGKAWLTSESLLPATTFLEEADTFPAFTGVPSTGTMTRRRSVASYVAGSNGLTAWWDLGALRSTILIVISSIAGPASCGPFISDTVPTGVEIPDKGYFFGVDSVSSMVFNMYKKASGTFTSLGTGFGHSGAGMGIYYDDATGKLIGLVRAADGQWYPAVEVTDSTLTTARYVGIRSFSTGYQAATPIGIYYTT